MLHLKRWKYRASIYYWIVIIVEANSTEFWKEDDIRGYDDWEEVVKGVNSLSMFDLMGVSDGMLLCPQKPGFIFILLLPGPPYKVSD